MGGDIDQIQSSAAQRRQNTLHRNLARPVADPQAVAVDDSRGRGDQRRRQGLIRQVLAYRGDHIFLVKTRQNRGLRFGGDQPAVIDDGDPVA